MNIYIYMHAVREGFELIRTFSYRMGYIHLHIYLYIVYLFLYV